MRVLRAILAMAAALGLLFAGVQAASAQITVSETWGAADEWYEPDGIYGNAMRGTVKDRADDGWCVVIERREDIGGGQTGWVRTGFVNNNYLDCTYDTNRMAWFITGQAQKDTLGIRMRKGNTSSVQVICANRSACLADTTSPLPG